ncbi:MAG: hypothetical protein H7318_13645 [Oligoflexus sp.]|nr:hypothetical protein [Oligoflexus sp.]
MEAHSLLTEKAVHGSMEKFLDLTTKLQSNRPPKDQDNWKRKALERRRLNQNLVRQNARESFSVLVLKVDSSFQFDKQLTSAAGEHH